jgi:hypothetical protein
MPLNGQQISQITIDPPHHGKFKGFRTVVLTEARDIEFVVQNLSNLKAKWYDHSQPVFDLLIQTSSGVRLTLRVSEHEVGPDAPASARNTHWFPRDTKAFGTFYDFLLQKTKPVP